MNTYLILILALLVQSCTISQVIEPTEITEGRELCIIENTAVREGFLLKFRDILARKGIHHKVIEAHSAPSSCEWAATYVGQWSWDLALYISYAEISVYHNGVLDGKAVYDARSGGANMGNLIDAEEKIQELVEELFQMESSGFRVLRTANYYV